MKKIIFTISILTGFALQAWAYDFQSGDLLYTVNDSNSPEVRLVGHVDGTAALGELVIPETVTYDGVIYKVTVIGKNAFRLSYPYLFQRRFGMSDANLFGSRRRVEAGRNLFHGTR